ncbi:hypothetical protein H257_01363 [Aphanomyces astaci]|uniref:Golgi apparatus membrane protein TVP15 n=2 Tax=Aphanomyces astaci TaxID=112090 RepID=W4H7F3_APHAT|nr:hypothetical protein H257_01363 [Aphanomyces astaci]ETV87965.1 hypothetical protein H257_01363 [Aphanomyces astaci]RHY07977.1 hypothetical protein DYB36_001531 [Aphanomyces astaci]RHY16442.1 hypothetical protein DYB25_001869 [Aphanomyces astaci]RHY73095.1 hypothetical protein DYB30_005395 [Aphanomyces astaci]RHY84400.1 hypothetical protein DYB31_002465 [Aphanomyces astaci]|eukprot:XP_009822828.1 hypothetical protein H257_01363 [Aphanomyces astaci]
MKLSTSLYPATMSKPMGSISSDSLNKPKNGDKKTVIDRIRNVDKLETPKLLRYMRVGNMLCCILQVFAGISGLASIVTLNITAVFVSLYVIMFGVLFLLFECRLSSLEPKIRANFGFLYSYHGRARFIFFIGFMDFGTGGGLGYLAGMIMCANAFLNFYIMYKHPEFASGNLSSSSDPTAGYAPASQEATKFLKNNPDIAMQATNYAFAQASSAAANNSSSSYGSRV